MPATAYSETYDQLLTTTLKNYRDTFVDNAFTAQPLVNWLKRKDNVKLIGGGNKIVVQIMESGVGSSQALSYAKSDTFTLGMTDGFTAAEYPWGLYGVTIGIYGIEEAQNNGEAAIIDLLEAKIKQAEMTAAENMDLMFLKDATGNSAKDWNGLFNLIGDSTDSITSVGGISASSNAYWNSYVNKNGGTDKVLALPDMATAYNTASRGNDHPDLVLSGQTLFEKYEALLQPQLRFQDNKTADGGFQNLMYKGAVYMFDVNMVNGTIANHHKRMFFVNSKYLTLYGHKDKWFTNTPFIRPSNQDARWSQILAYGQLCISARNRQARLDNRIP
jgi:hypothetical protein